MRPIPSGRRRMTSSVTPGRSVGLIMPTTPRQLENAMLRPLRLLFAVGFCRSLHRHISLGQIAGKRCGLALSGVAISAAARALQQEAVAHLHLVTAGRRLALACGPEPGHEAPGGARRCAGETARWK